MDTADLAAEVVREAQARGAAVIGIAGGVAVGKSTLAARVSSLTGWPVITADSYLRSNAELEAMGAAHRKGHPDTYHHDALVAALRSVRTQAVEVPVYDHATYDVTAESETIGPAPAVVVEGLHVLSPEVRPAVQLGVYLHAPRDVLRAWFCERFAHLVAEARRSPPSFYEMFTDLDDPTVRSVAEATWDAINGPTVRDFVERTAENADIVVDFDASRGVQAIRRP